MRSVIAIDENGTVVSARRRVPVHLIKDVEGMLAKSYPDCIIETVEGAAEQTDIFEVKVDEEVHVVHALTPFGALESVLFKLLDVGAVDRFKNADNVSIERVDV